MSLSTMARTGSRLMSELKFRPSFPTTTVRDMVVHDNDLVVCTEGRGIWTLDDIEPLRESHRIQSMNDRE